MSTQEQNQNAQSDHQPVDVLRDRDLKVSIFCNQGQHGDFYSHVPSRIYTDKQTNKIKETRSLTGSHLLQMGKLLEKSYDREN